MSSDPRDLVAIRYGARYKRRVDKWEDLGLASRLDFYLHDRDVLDLGCGFGWALWNLGGLNPRRYVGVDAFADTLTFVTDHWPWVATVRARVGSPNWAQPLAGKQFDAIVATSKAHEFGDLSELLETLIPLVRPGGQILLHGRTSRRRRREHYTLVDVPEDREHWNPQACRVAGVEAGLTWRGAWGNGAAPDWTRSRALWTLSRSVPAGWHYSFLAVWRVPESAEGT